MSDEKRGADLNEGPSVGTEATETSGTTTTQTPDPKKSRRKPAIVIGIIAVIAVAAVGVFIWHNDPSFCGAVCHDSMSTYVNTYNEKSGQAGTDAYGNAVADSSAMLVVSHKDAGLNCLSCHVPTLSQQLGEVQETLAGSYYYPLEEVGVEQLMVNSGHEAGTGDQFCLRSGCHEFTRADLTEKTADLEFNPHQWHHSDTTCSDCHKSHRASVFSCTQCHSSAYGSMPDGWVSYAEGRQILEAGYNAGK